jgi:autotransporter adhesin
MLGSASLAATTGVALPQAAHAQALQPVVDVCTGVQLNDSLLRDVLSRTVVPTATGVEALFDNFLNLSILGIPLLTLPDVNLGVAQTTADIAAGNVVSLQVLDTNGNVVSPGTCNVTADGYALNTPAGIAIGGNQITGLGNGTPASAGELDAIAFGNGALTAVGATGAVALGTGASVSAANGVALGAGSTNTRGPQIGYAAFGITGPVDSAGSVSIGSPGAERQLTNLAPGTAATDAATVGQVQGAIAAITSDAIQYDDPTHASVTLDGAGGTVVTGVGAGAIAAGSSDAVNGDQLFATNQQVAANTAGIAANAGDIATLQGQVTVNTGDIGTLQGQVAANTGDIGTLQGQVGANTADIATNTAGIATNTADIAALQATGVQYDDATQSSITLAGAGGTTIGNLAAGDVSAGSTEAVNGSQLFATNQQVAANTSDIAALQTGLGSVVGDIGNLQADVTTNTADIAALDGRVTVNEGNIIGLDGRVTTNEGDIASLDGRVTVNEDNITNLDGRVTIAEADISGLDDRVTVNEGDIANLDGRVTVNEGNLASLTTNVGAIDTRVTANETNITVLQAQVANVPVQFVSDADRTTPSSVPTNTVALASASGGPATLTNVAAGTLSATSTDAVNGAQLFATNQNVAQNTADIATLSSNIAGSTVVAVQYSDPGAPTVSNGGTVTNDVTFVGADASVPVRVHNVADGIAATDATNLGQLQTAMTQLQGNIDQGLLDAKAYTDIRIAEIGFDLNDLRKDAFSGTAAAMAMAAIPQTMTVGESMMGGAVGYYRGQTAFGFGLSTTLSDRVVVKASGTVDTHGKGGMAAGAGIAF